MNLIYHVTSPECSIVRGPVEVPDPEYGRVATYRGFRVFDTDTGAVQGHCWHDGSFMCWRTLDQGHYGQELSARHAIRHILFYRRLDGYAA